MSRASQILRQIRRNAEIDPYGILKMLDPKEKEPELPSSPLTADMWQEFKRKFVEEYNGEPIQPTGMTHSEYLNYIRTSGFREGDEEEHWHTRNINRYNLKEFYYHWQKPEKMSADDLPSKLRKILEKTIDEEPDEQELLFKKLFG